MDAFPEVTPWFPATPGQFLGKMLPVTILAVMSWVSPVVSSPSLLGPSTWHSSLLELMRHRMLLLTACSPLLLAAPSVFLEQMLNEN